MEYVLSHRTAALAVQVPKFREAMIGKGTLCSLPQDFMPFINRRQASKLAEALDIEERLCGLSLPNSTRLKNGFAFTRYAVQGIDGPSFIKLSNALYVARPELIFLQMARELPFVDLIRLGYDLCGTYAPGHGSGSTAYNLDPLTSKAQIDEFLRGAVGVPGSKAARKALGYVEDKSASPRESILAILLKLPYSAGGFNQPYFQMNSLFSTKVNDRFPDLFFPQFNLDLEYDSDEFHDDKTRDAIRRNQLLALDLRTLTVTKDLLDDYDRLFEMMRGFYALAGQRFYPRTKNYLEKSKALHKHLLQPEWYKQKAPSPYSFESGHENDGRGEDGCSKATAMGLNVRK